MDEFNLNNNGSDNNTLGNTGFSSGSGNLLPQRQSPWKSDNMETFYSKKYKKSRKPRNFGLVQLIAVALISSIMGGFAFGAFFLTVAPNLQPEIKSYINETFFGGTLQNVPATSTDSIKKVEIINEKSDSVVTAVAEKVGPSVVGIRVTSKVVNFFFGEQERSGEGSGIIMKEDGYILTNYHVIANALDQRGKQRSDAKIEVFLTSKDDKPYEATIVGYDWRTDLAVIKINATGLQAAEFGDSDKLKVGELAIAIGNPGGLEFMGSVTVGVISGLNRTISLEGTAGSSALKQLKLIQTDAAINPGNSGGALVNSKGEVIGVNSSKIVAEEFEGIGFAIPSNTALKIANDLISSGYVRGRPILGVIPDTTFTEDVAKRFNVPAGVLVEEVVPFSGAYEAGIKKGDIITRFDGQPVKNRYELDELRDRHAVGDIVEVEIYRYSDKKYYTLKVKLSEDTGNN